MKQYHDLIRQTIANGTYKPNRTGVDTISNFSHHYSIDLKNGFPLITTKDLSGYRWNSLLHEIDWYLSGEEHIRNLKEETKIWNAWASEKGELDTAYGRFWRRYPIPNEINHLPGETWVNTTEGRWENNEDIDPSRWINNQDTPKGRPTFDQLQYVVDMLNENPHSRRLVINAWHPSNAAISTLPPCHFTYVLNVQGDKLNCHLTQRSGDIALGIPFNIAAYAILTKIIAMETGFEVGKFSHTIADAHIYCGSKQRGEFYGEELPTIKHKLNVEGAEGAIEYIKNNAPREPDDNEDHLPGLLMQTTRSPYDRPNLKINEQCRIDNFDREMVELRNYTSHDGIKFKVAE